MIFVEQNDEVYEIRFPYDPVLVDLIKQVPGKRWNPQGRYWIVPKDRLGFFFNQIKGTQYETEVNIHSEEGLNVNASVEFTRHDKIPDIDISDYNIRVQDGFSLFKHQTDCLKFYKYRLQNRIGTGFILADQPGSGKTLQAMNMALYKRDVGLSKHCLIIACVNSAKYNWVDDIRKHTNGQEVPYLLGSRVKRNGTIKICGSKEKLQDLQNDYMYGDPKYGPLPYFIVMNIEAFQMKEGKLRVITQELTRLVQNNYFGMIALDEIHKNASPQSIQGKEILKLKKMCPRSVDWIPITGTPITKKPTDVFTPLLLVGGHDTLSFWSWQQRYCVFGGFGGHEIIAYKNMDQLKNLLEPNMLRRKKDEFIDLPPKIRMVEYIENTPYQQKLQKEIERDLSEHRERVLSNMNPLSEFLHLRQVNGAPELVDDSLSTDDEKSYLSKNAKMKRCIELIDEIVEQGEKVLVFSNWIGPLKTLYNFLKSRYGVCCYIGTMKQQSREQHKLAFQTNPNYPIMLGTVGAMGTSHTLTAARNIIFLDECWNPSDQEQCEDRCHRPGQTQSLNIYTLISVDTVDERVHNILSKKEGISKYIVDNSLDIKSNPELFDLLLGHK